MVGEEDLNNSILAIIGGAISWLFAPLGFGNWQYAVAVVTGLIAKENVVATLSVLFGIDSAGDLSALAGYSFLVFNLLCAPCFAAMGAIKREMNSGKWTMFAIGYQTVFAYIVSLCLYQIGSAVMGNLNIVGLIVSLIFIAFAIFMLAKPYKEATKLTKKL
jgi:ferrous iron transport protein B